MGGERDRVGTDSPFADVTAYIADYWLMFKGSDKYLAYTQTILMKLNIKGARYIFPHITCNTLTYCNDACERPAPCTIKAEKDPCPNDSPEKPKDRKSPEHKPKDDGHDGKKKQK